jgi:iron complex transport system permease protein
VLRSRRRALRGAPIGALCLVLVVVLAGSIALGVATGSVRIPPDEVWRGGWAHVLGEPSGVAPGRDHVVWLIRLPRTLLAALVGAALAVVGVAIQALVRNVLADPYLLGVSSGASVGATAVILFGGFGALGVYALSAAAFAGALLAMTTVFLLAQQQGRITPLKLILAGTAMGYGFGALASFLIFRAETPDGLRAVLHWLLGSLGGARWSYLTLPAIGFVVATTSLGLNGRQLNALVMGDETARTLGVDVDGLRRRVFVVASLLTGLVVAVSGAVGFVGLMLPHVTRMFVGADHRRVLPIAALLGAVFMVWVDVAARTLVAPEELPLGVITALLGVPFFVWLLRRKAF